MRMIEQSGDLSEKYMESINMNRNELMDFYTAEQLADTVIELRTQKYELRKRIDEYENHLLPRASEKARALIDKNIQDGVVIVTCDEWDNNKNKSEAEKYQKSFDNEKKKHDFQIKKYQDRAEKDKTELERARNTINQIDGILEKLFGVRHDTVDNPNEFERILSDKLKERAIDIRTTEPINVAEMLINSIKEERNPNERLKFIRHTFAVSDLRQIAEHLLVYCNHNGGGAEELNDG